MSKEVVQTTKCDVCGKNVTEQEEGSGVHLCPTDQAYHNVGNALKIEKEKEAAAKKLETDAKKLEAEATKLEKDTKTETKK